MSRACVVVVVVAVWTVGSESSGTLADDRRGRTSALNRLLARLCGAILAGDDDVIDDRKRKWGDNTMNSWGKRDVDGGGGGTYLHVLSFCESLEHSRRVRDENVVSTGRESGGNDDDDDYTDVQGTRWRQNDAKVVTDDRRALGDDNVGGGETTKRKWGDNSMATWGKRRWGENSMSTWGKRDN